ncbi:pentatricopeptide repeat-containing protein At2g33680-like [Malania oleifera]|uniref:pentatricopeptide repeat-containing protein At2g33680-like n=1 Tax=Malania oleifera TaxID=397392 RepID=UPI0025AE7793|nr:pentatricopeptide repeat-containing protein At2g33680-like [Malania oleifera]
MYALLPTPLLASPPNPQLSVPPLKTKPFSKSLSSSCKLLHGTQNPNASTTQFAEISKVSACDQTSLLNDWPQLLQISIGSGDFLLGQAIHAFLVKWGCQNDNFQGNNMVNFYGKFKRLDDAQQVFDEMLVRNTISWTSLLKGYLQINDVESVFLIAREMYGSEEEFNEHTCSVILQACNSLEDLVQGEQIHGFVIKCGFGENVIVGTSLVSMYLRSGYLDDAEKVFDDMAYKDVRCLNFMITEYRNAGCGEKAIQSFLHLLDAGLEPNDYTFTNIISSCYNDMGVKEGRQLHGLATKYGVVCETSVGNAVISMYSKHGMVEEAEKMFCRMDERNLISWTALLSGYVKNGCSQKALVGFLEILQHGIYCDSSCLVTVLDGCSECKNLELGCQIHGLVMKLGYLSDVNVGTALIDLYAKSRNQKSVKLIFNGLSSQNTASFNAVLSFFMDTDGDNEEDAFDLFNILRLAGLEPDSVTFARLLSLSADQACLVRGRSLHGYAIKTGFENDVPIGNAVITMYAKCGCIEDAYRMFECMESHDCISWNAIISAYALHGQGRSVILLFEEMKKAGFLPDGITILAVLQACNYSGLSEYGVCLFNDMKPKYGIWPVLEHFACMVDLLGRAGHLSKAMDFINQSPFPDSPLLWRTLVHVCKLHQELSIGKMASERLLDLVPREAGSYMLVSNMYAGGGMLDEAAKVRTIMNKLKVSKEAGYSWIEIDDKVHQFLASSKDHPESGEIYSNLDLLGSEMKCICNDRTDIQMISDLD